jgi:hypothetical protein
MLEIDAQIKAAQDKARAAQQAYMWDDVEEGTIPVHILREARDAAEAEFERLMSSMAYEFPHTDADDNDVMRWDYHMCHVWSMTLETVRVYVSYNGSGLWSYVITEHLSGRLERRDILDMGTRLGEGLLPMWARGPLGAIAYKAADYDMAICQEYEGEPYEDYDGVDDLSWDDDTPDMPDTGYYGY